MKLQKAYKLTWNHYNKRSISLNAKLRHYNAVVLTEALYAAETTVLKGMSKIHEIEKQERKILRKIFGAVLKDGKWIKRPTKELYERTETITDTFRKRRLKFYGHLHRMSDDRLTKKIFNIVAISKNKTNWIKETQDDLKLLGLTDEDIKDRTKFRNKIKNKKFEQEPKKKRNGIKWTEERKTEHSECMKRYWEIRRRKKR